MVCRNCRNMIFSNFHPEKNVNLILIVNLLRTKNKRKTQFNHKISINKLFAYNYLKNSYKILLVINFNIKSYTY
jgi:hypothetical protein